VLASVYFVGKTVQRWNAPVIMSFIVGTAIAIAISVLNPATENEGFIYLMLCGVAGICSMILPGLSGSFILFIMGNYKLVVIDAVNNLDAGILLPVAIGAIVGLLAFSHLLSWVLKRYRNQTIALLTGFILGSLRILWPWQSPVYLVDENSTPILKDGAEVIVSYKQYFPDSFSSDVLLAIFWIIIGIVSIALIEYFAAKQAKKV
jgi:putative membrane protein